MKFQKQMLLSIYQQNETSYKGLSHIFFSVKKNANQNVVDQKKKFVPEQLECYANAKHINVIYN